MSRYIFTKRIHSNKVLIFSIDYRRHFFWYPWCSKFCVFHQGQKRFHWFPNFKITAVILKCFVPTGNIDEFHRDAPLNWLRNKLNQNLSGLLEVHGTLNVECKILPMGTSQGSPGSGSSIGTVVHPHSHWNGQYQLKRSLVEEELHTIGCNSSKPRMRWRPWVVTPTTCAVSASRPKPNAPRPSSNLKNWRRRCSRKCKTWRPLNVSAKRNWRPPAMKSAHCIGKRSFAVKAEMNESRRFQQDLKDFLLVDFG